MSAPDFRALAPAHAADGFLVIPANGKRPIANNWPEVASKDPADVDRMARQHPRANVAGATGHDRFLVDFDKKNGGLESFEVLDAEIGPLLTPDSWRVYTGSGDGSFQLWFTLPAGCPIKNSTGEIAPGVDVRGHHGCGILPGSVHPQTGRTYEWDPEHSPRTSPKPPTPSWALIQRLLPPPPAPPPPAASAPRPAAGDRVDAGILLDRYLRLARNGNRNDIGFKLLQQAYWNGYSRAEVEDIAREYVDRVDQSGERYTLREALDSVDQAFKSRPGEPWGYPTGGAGHRQHVDLDQVQGEDVDADVADDCAGVRDALAEARAQIAALKREVAQLREVNEVQKVATAKAIARAEAAEQREGWMRASLSASAGTMGTGHRKHLLKLVDIRATFQYCADVESGKVDAEGWVNFSLSSLARDLGCSYSSAQKYLGMRCGDGKPFEKGYGEPYPLYNADGTPKLDRRGRQVTATPIKIRLNPEPNIQPTVPEVLEALIRTPVTPKPPKDPKLPIIAVLDHLEDAGAKLGEVTCHHCGTKGECELHAVIVDRACGEVVKEYAYVPGGGLGKFSLTLTPTPNADLVYQRAEIFRNPEPAPADGNGNGHSPPVRPVDLYWRLRNDGVPKDEAHRRAYLGASP